MSVAVVAIVRPSGVSARGGRRSAVRVSIASIAPPVPALGRRLSCISAPSPLTQGYAVLSFRHLRVIDYAECARRGVDRVVRASSAVWCADRRRVSRAPGRARRGRHPGSRQLGRHRRPARPPGRDPDDPGHARAVGRAPRRRVLSRDRATHPGLHEHRSRRHEHGRRHGHGVRRFDRGRAAHGLGAHVHARGGAAPGARPAARRGQPAHLRARREGVVAAVAGRRAPVRPPPRLEPDAVRAAGPDPARPADGRPGRGGRGQPPGARPARGARPDPSRGRRHRAGREAAGRSQPTGHRGRRRGDRGGRQPRGSSRWPSGSVRRS